MSRGRDDDDRIDHTDRAPDRRDERPLSARAEDIAREGLTLPRGEARERVEFRDREYSLNGSETRALATVGAFRVIAPADIGDDRHGKDVWHGDWRSLAEQGLLTRESLVDPNGVRHVVALTREGKDLLEAHSATRSDGRSQAYYADIVKPRELRHDTQIYPLYREEAARIEAEGGRITRVILDYELKADYQRYLNREPGEDGVDLVRDRARERRPSTDPGGARVRASSSTRSRARHLRGGTAPAHCPA
jgi:hypothetical protein